MKRDEEAVERVRRELIAILERQHKVMERDLLRLSAMTGVAYSTIVRIQEEIPRLRGSRGTAGSRRQEGK